MLTVERKHRLIKINAEEKEPHERKVIKKKYFNDFNYCKWIKVKNKQIHFVHFKMTFFLILWNLKKDP